MGIVFLRFFFFSPSVPFHLEFFLNYWNTVDTTRNAHQYVGKWVFGPLIAFITNIQIKNNTLLVPQDSSLFLLRCLFLSARRIYCHLHSINQWSNIYNYFPNYMAYNFYSLYINYYKYRDYMQYFSFWIWLISLSIMVSSCIHLVADVRVSVFFMAL